MFCIVPDKVRFIYNHVSIDPNEHGAVLMQCLRRVYMDTCRSEVGALRLQIARMMDAHSV